jgi:hypothetical protein
MLRRSSCRVFRLLVAANVVPSSPFLVTLMMGAIRSSETVLTDVTSQMTALFILTAVKTSDLTWAYQISQN